MNTTTKTAILVAKPQFSHLVVGDLYDIEIGEFITVFTSTTTAKSEKISTLSLNLFKIYEV